MDLNEEQPRVSKSKVHFKDIGRSVRVNPSLPLQELDPNDQMDTDEDNDIESISSSKNVDIIGKTPNRNNVFIDYYDFENVSLGSHDDTYDSDVEIDELDRITTHVRSIN